MKARIPKGEIRYDLKVEPEDLSLEGNVMASGDEETDRQAVAEVQRQLDAGNEWAWCCVIVTASWNGFSGSAVLGACSYASEADFRASDYFADLRNEATDELAANIESAYLRSKTAMRR